MSAPRWPRPETDYGGRNYPDLPPCPEPFGLLHLRLPSHGIFRQRIMLPGFSHQVYCSQLEAFPAKCA